MKCPLNTLMTSNMCTFQEKLDNWRGGRDEHTPLFGDEAIREHPLRPLASCCDLLENLLILLVLLQL
jgi:hypothetical protein